MSKIITNEEFDELVDMFVESDNYKHYKVNVVDAPMGEGKTSSLINFINEDKMSDDVYRYMYVTPYLDEVKRIKESCKDKHFIEPSDAVSTKTENIKELINQGKNIVTTHALFQYFDAEMVQLAFLNRYILVMDEVADVVGTTAISKSDRQNIFSKHAKIEKDGLIVWTDKSYSGEYNKYKKMCEIESLYAYGNNNSTIAWNFPVSIFKAFRRVYILTYMFDAQIQKYYFDFHNVEYNYLYVKKEGGRYCLTDVPQKYDIKRYKPLISIHENSKLNDIGEFETALSKTWFDTWSKNDKVTKLIKNNIENYVQKISKSHSNKVIWTVYKEYKKLYSGKGYTKGFVALNTRGTNMYKDRTCVVYFANRFPNPYVKQFFLFHKVKINYDLFALSEMLQFIFRSAIREYNNINVYIPSKRMRNLLHSWLNEEVILESQSYENMYEDLDENIEE